MFAFLRGLVSFIVTVISELIFLFVGLLGLLACVLGVERSFAEQPDFWTTEMVQIHLLGVDTTSLMVWDVGFGLIVVGAFLFMIAVWHFDHEPATLLPPRPLLITRPPRG